MGRLAGRWEQAPSPRVQRAMLALQPTGTRAHANQPSLHPSPDRTLATQATTLTSKLPGYLMLSARAPIDALPDMPEAALAELGGLLANIQRVMQTQLQPKWLYISRYGHMPASHCTFIAFPFMTG